MERFSIPATSTTLLFLYSSGLAIERLVESINKLTYGEEIDSFIEGYLTV